LKLKCLNSELRYELFFDYRSELAHFSEFVDCLSAKKFLLLRRSKEESMLYGSFLRGGGTYSLSLFSPPTSSPRVIPSNSPPTMAAKRLNLPPVPITVASYTLSDAPLPTPAGWWRCPSSLRLSLARDDDNGSDVHRCSCSCRHVVVILVVMLVVVLLLLLSVIPSHCCCHRHRYHL